MGIMGRKGVYPYDYMNSFAKFDEVELPGKKEFFSLLNNKECSDEDLNHAKEVWDTMEVKNIMTNTCKVTFSYKLTYWKNLERPVLRVIG